MGNEYEWGRAARMRCYREYVGLAPVEMAALLRIAPRSYQRFENGQAAIPSGIWDLVAKVVEQFEDQVAKLLDDAGDDGLRVKVWRGPSDDAPLPSGMWMRIVSQAMAENPGIEPYFPEDEQQDTA